MERIAPGFGGINLEDISAPRCFEIEERLKAQLDIPVFHDDQHGTAVVVLAALINACKLTGRELASLRVLVTGLGAAGVAVTKILMEAGVSGHRRLPTPRGSCHTERADYLDGSDERRQALVRGGHQPRSCSPAPRPTRWRAPTSSSACRARASSPPRSCAR